MNVDFKLPALGENVAGGDVVSVLVREGDVIAANDGVLEIETDKAVVEIPCPHAGKITKVRVGKGQAVKVGQPVLTRGNDGDATGLRRAGARGESRSAAVCRSGAEPADAGRSRPGRRRVASPANWASICRGQRQRQGRSNHGRGRPRGGGQAASPSAA